MSSQPTSPERNAITDNQKCCSSPMPNHDVDMAVMEKENLSDISLIELSSGSSKKCSDSDCSLCLSNLSNKKYLSDAENSMNANKSSSSDSSTQSSLIKALRIRRRDRNSNSKSLDNDEAFWHLYRIAFNTSVEPEPQNDSEYYKFAENCALATLLHNDGISENNKEI